MHCFSRGRPSRLGEMFYVFPRVPSCGRRRRQTRPADETGPCQGNREHAHFDRNFPRRYLSHRNLSFARRGLPPRPAILPRPAAFDSLKPNPRRRRPRIDPSRRCECGTRLRDVDGRSAAIRSGTDEYIAKSNSNRCGLLKKLQSLLDPSAVPAEKASCAGASVGSPRMKSAEARRRERMGSAIARDHRPLGMTKILPEKTHEWDFPRLAICA